MDTPAESLCIFDYGIHWWAAALHAGRVVINTGERGLDRRHGHHRYAVLGPGGVQSLTIPITGDSRTKDTTMGEVRISEHANWRRTHWGALYSAYGRTPYFDYVADELHAVIHGGQPLLLDFNRQMAQLVTEFMQLPIGFDYQDLPGEEAGAVKFPTIHDVPYYQLWSDRYGFTPGLSILDLMMNEGPEGIHTLQKMTT